jgi:CRP-like cAMP-binding protein
MIQKVLFIKECFDLTSPKLPKMALHLELEYHQENQVVFRKGDKGEYFYIVLEGAYCV